MITLYQFDPVFGMPNASPFCMKVETYLRMCQLPFEAPRMTMGHLQKAPKGKLPYIVDKDVKLADSTFIIDYLKATYGDTLDGWLSAEQRAVGLAMQRLMEENLYWPMLYSRWMEPAAWEQVRPLLFKDLPGPLKVIVPPLARRGLAKEMHGHGMGRHSREEIYAIGKRDITALADFLGDKTYFMGERPSSFDATAFAFIAGLVLPTLESELRTYARQYNHLVVYAQRMMQQYYPA